MSHSPSAPIGAILSDDAAMPDINPDAVAAATDAAEAADKPAVQDAVCDKAGNLFDPAIFESEADGTPRYRQDGTFRKKRGNAGKGSKPAVIKAKSSKCETGTQAQPAVVNNEAAAPVVYDPDEVKASAQQFSGMYWFGMGFAFGQHGAPSESENKLTELAFEHAFEKIGPKGLPWYLELGFALSMPVAKRLMMPEVRAEIASRKGGILGKIGGLFRKGDAKPSPAPAQAGPDAVATF